MGQMLATWVAQVQRVASDAAGVQIDDTDATRVGVLPALAQYSIDRPRVVTIESAGAGTAYVALPTAGDGWVTGFSSIDRIEYPARQNPPRYLDGQTWEVTGSTGDVDTKVIVLYDVSPAASEYVRVTFSTSWPAPDATASTDQLDDVAYHAVSTLAAAMCVANVATEAARDRGGALATAFANGSSRARELREAAQALRGTYDAFLGRATANNPGGGAARPVSVPFDFDPAYLSMFHGGRR